MYVLNSIHVIILLYAIKIFSGSPNRIQKHNGEIHGQASMHVGREHLDHSIMGEKEFRRPQISKVAYTFIIFLILKFNSQ